MNTQILKTAAAFALGNVTGRNNGQIPVDEEMKAVASFLITMFPNTDRSELEDAFKSAIGDINKIKRPQSH